MSLFSYCACDQSQYFIDFESSEYFACLKNVVIVTLKIM